jgi:hypothetical protein
MTTEDEMQEMLRGSLPKVAASLAKIATDPKGSATRRLKSIELLLRLARGPTTRTADYRDAANARVAREALVPAVPFLDQLAKEHSSDRIRSRAAKLRAAISKIES